MNPRDAVRAEMLARRAALPADVQRAHAQAVRDTILAWEGLQGPVFAYASVRGELGTRLLLDALAARGFQVLLPRLIGPGIFEAAVHDGVFEPGGFGIPGPRGPVVEPAVALVPGVAFDRQGNRIGHGAGYYDRWLAAHPAVRTVGLAHAFQVVDALPVATHDVPVQGLLTERGWALRP